MDELIEILKEIEINPDKQQRIASAIRDWIKQKTEQASIEDGVTYESVRKRELYEALGI